jgi:hypothetical protein
MAANNRHMKRANHGKRPCSGKKTRWKKRINTPR